MSCDQKVHIQRDKTEKRKSQEQEERERREAERIAVPDWPMPKPVEVPHEAQA